VKHFLGSKVPAVLLPALGAAVFSGLLYPGDKGYSLTQNYFSDLGMTVTPDGGENLAGALLFLGACGAFGYAIWRYARLLGSVARESADRVPGGDRAPGPGPGQTPGARGDGDADGRVPGAAAQGDRIPSHGQTYSVGGVLSGGSLGGLVAGSGVLIGGFLAAVFFLLTGLTPKNLLFDLHNWVSYSAFLALMLLWVSAAFVGPRGWPRGIHVSMVLLSAGYLAVLFSRPSWEMPDGWALQVVAQKIVVIGNWLGLLLGAALFPKTIVSRET
jgi:hypothetical protein